MKKTGKTGKKEERWERKITKKERAKFKNIKKFELAQQDGIHKLQKYVDIILKELGHSEALVTDESWVSDFLPFLGTDDREEEFNKFKSRMEDYGVIADYNESIVELAKRLKKSISE